jgi:hypothetical protein
MPDDLYFEFDRTEASPPLGAARSRPESGTLLESVQELRELLRAFNTDDREDAAPKGASADPIASVAVAGVPGEADPACEEPDDAEAFYASLMAGLGMPSDGAAASPDPFAAMPESPPRRRRSTAFAVVAVAGGIVLGATGLVMARGPDLHLLMTGVMTSASGNGQPHSGDRDDAAARAALPPVVAAVARGEAAPHDLPRQAAALAVAGSHRASAAVLLPAAAIAQVGPARASGDAVASTAPAQAVAPRRTSATAPTAHPAAQAGTAPPAASGQAASARRPGEQRVAAQTPSAVMPSPADRAAGKQLRAAGDARIVEGDIASARLFYERAAADGDAQAALDLGNSFNPAFLERLGVLGMRGNVAVAARWYRRARVLGNPDAGKALQTLTR